MFRAAALALAVTVTLAACEDSTTRRRASGGSILGVVATTPVLADLAESVMGEGSDVRSLVPPGADPHEFVVPELEHDTVEAADLLVVNGGGLEPELAPILDLALEAGVEVVVALRAVDRPGRTASGDPDPHFWHDPARTGEVVTELAERMATLDAGNGRRYRAAARARVAELRDLGGDLDEILGPVPEARRGLVTMHDFLGTFAERFGFDVAATVVPGLSSQGQPTASSRLAAVEALEGGACAIFVPESSDDTLAQALADEAEAEVGVVRLAADTLVRVDQGYDDAMRENAQAVATALTGCEGGRR